MALDKLVDSSQLDTDLTSVANAIRAKGGTSASLAFPSGFVSAVQAIPSGGGGFTPDQWFTGTNTDTAVIGDVLPNRMHAFSYSPFRVVRWELTTNTASRITTQYVISYSEAEIIVMPFYTGTFNALYVFRDNKKLKTIDLKATNFFNTLCNGCTLLDTIILRHSAIVQMPDINALGGTAFASGGAGGSIYIPKALFDHLGDGSSLDYKAATSWATLDGYGTITWAKIEGSIYETQYADGTPIL